MSRVLSRLAIGRHQNGVGVIIPVTRTEKLLGEKAKSWAGRCYEIACACVEKKVVDGVAVYGHWRGAVHERSLFYRGGGAPFQRHGWVQLPADGDGTVWDPTRWVFEAVQPYIYIGPAGTEYDEGGNAWRKALHGPPPDFDPDDRMVHVPGSVLPSEAWRFVEHYLGIDYAFTKQEPGVLTTRQIVYLANAPLSDLGVHADAIYRALELLDQDALIPIDNHQRIQREREAKADTLRAPAPPGGRDRPARSRRKSPRTPPARGC